MTTPTAHPGMELPDRRMPVVLSTHEHELLARDAAAILTYLDGRDSVAVEQVSATLLQTRRVRRHRAVIRAAGLDELKDALAAIAAGHDHPLVATSSATVAPATAFVFPGQGNQWPGMGCAAYRSLPVYRDEADRCAAVFGDAPLRYLLAENDNPDDSWSQFDTQSAQFTHAVSLARVWQSCAVEPGVTVGHSLGEVGAAYIAGRIGLDDAAAIVTARAGVIDGIGGDYGMGVLAVSAAQAERLIGETPGWLEVSVVNAPQSVVVSGEAAAVARIVDTVAAGGAFARLIAVNFPAHTSALDALHDELLGLLPDAKFSDSPVELIGSAHGAKVPHDTAFRDYWYDNLRNTVRFDRAVQAAAAAGTGSYVEMSAHPTLLIALGDLVGDDALTLSSSRRDEDVTDHLSGSIVAAAAADPGYHWASYLPAGTARLQGFPNAPMAKVHLWARPEPLPDAPLQIAVRTWAPAAVEPGPPRRVAVVGLPGADPDVVQRLCAAAGQHTRCEVVAPAVAEAVIVLGPRTPDGDATRELADLVGSGLLRAMAPPGDACRDLWLITAGAEELPGDGAPDPVQAALTGMHRSVGFEHPDCAFRRMDLPSWSCADEVVSAVLDGLFTAAEDLAVRVTDDGAVLFRGALEQVRLEPAQGDPGLLDDVVITGGNGAVGLHFARHLIGRGARRVLLLSRRGVSPDALAQLQNTGATVGDVRCDVTDPESVRAAVGGHAGKGATLIVHAAGTAVFGPAETLDAEAVEITFGAKCRGLEQVMAEWPRREGCRTLVCSSVSGLWGGSGHGLYSGANRLLDALVARYRRAGHSISSIRWGLWPGEGIVDAEETARIRRSGLSDMAPAHAIDAALSGVSGDPLIFAADPNRLAVFLPDAGDSAAPERVQQEAPSAADIVSRELSAALRQSGSAGIDLSASLIDIGVDSLLALDLRKRLRRATGTAVPLAALLGGITGRELVDLIEASPEPERVALV